MLQNSCWLAVFVAPDKRFVPEAAKKLGGDVSHLGHRDDVDL